MDSGQILLNSERLFRDTFKLTLSVSRMESFLLLSINSIFFLNGLYKVKGGFCDL